MEPPPRHMRVIVPLAHLTVHHLDSVEVLHRRRAQNLHLLVTRPQVLAIQTVEARQNHPAAIHHQNTDLPTVVVLMEADLRLPLVLALGGQTPKVVHASIVLPRVHSVEGRETQFKARVMYP